MKFKDLFLFLELVLFTQCLMACSSKDNSPTFPEDKTYNMTGFARGADISWLTEMENDDLSFYNAAGQKKDCIMLMRELGVNAVRLRVWVNPTDGWCNKSDMLAKAYRANSLGMRIMVDFHYSDSWADPSKQTKPAAWTDYTFDELKQAVADHTTKVLTAMKSMNITPEWVQVGNETGNGMLWDDNAAISGEASTSMANYAALNNAGYDAVKAVFPNTKVIVHLQEGNKKTLYTWIFDGLKENGGKWDVIGMSLYPEADTWETLTTDCITNMNYLIKRYNCDVCVCEVGMPVDDAAAGKEWLTEFMKEAKAINGCLGIFYWEPECYGDWKNYGKGAFDADGKPTAIMDAFANTNTNK